MSDDKALDEIAKWLRDMGYPFNWSAPDHPLPEILRRPLAVAWQAEDDPGTDIDVWLAVLHEEGGW